MRTFVTFVAAMMFTLVCGTAKAQDNVNIGKSNIKLKSRMMTP